MLAKIHADEPRSARDLRGEVAAAQSALLLIVGIVASAPLALVAVALVHPQPPWRDAAQFAAEFHWIQVTPYVGGFLLVASCVALIASLCSLMPAARRARANFALAVTAAFAALIVLNYIVQTTLVPSLVSPYHDDNGPLVTMLTMSSPRSFGWALEMWGYAVFGVATWAIAPAFGSSRLERATAALFVLNGIASIAAAVATSLWPGSPMTAPGFIGFAVWNALMVTMAVLVILVMRRRVSGNVATPRARLG
ncbi:MAG TPA: hypothetical protein VFV99_20045 [Kofleriaceae bacterium]|nr:hypothetical protein [Kofleriaceae bacterium]